MLGKYCIFFTSNDGNDDFETFDFYKRIAIGKVSIKWAPILVPPIKAYIWLCMSLAPDHVLSGVSHLYSYVYTVIYICAVVIELV